MAVTRRGLLQAGAAAAGVLVAPGTARAALAKTRASVRPGAPAQLGPFRILAGSLHDHSTDSDGDSASEQIVTWLAEHRRELGIDFATLSDHSDFFPVASGQIPLVTSLPIATPVHAHDKSCGYTLPKAATKSADELRILDLWRRQTQLAQRYSDASFSFVHGFEWTNDQQNHLNVLMSSNWTSRFITGDAWLNMAPFWDWLTSEPTADLAGLGIGFGGGDGIGQFNHPGDKGALNWDDYGYNPQAAARMALIEIHGDQGYKGRSSSDAGWYWYALSQGWIVSPAMNWDWHDWASDKVLANGSPGKAFGEGGYLPGQRTLVLARTSHRNDIRDALVNRRTSASEIPDLWATLRAGTHWQGQTVKGAPGDHLTLTIDAGSLSEPLSHVEIVSDNGIDPHIYYDGDNADWDEFHSQLTPSYVVQHERFIASAGHATRKDRIDAPPPHSIIARANLKGARDQVRLTVRIPGKASPRPDGRHFFYAIVYAGEAKFPARCWTGPILTTH